MAVCSSGAALFHSEGNGNASMLGSLVIYAATVATTVAAVQWLNGGMMGSGAAVLAGTYQRRCILLYPSIQQKMSFLPAHKA